MARILMAWELGAGYGHLAPLLTLALPLREAGHEVTFAVRDTTVAERVLAPAGIAFVQAPANFAPGGSALLRSFPQILDQTCCNDALEMRARARAWRSLYAELHPHVLVADHSPTALLAARGLDLKCVVSGTGFVTPPDVTPMPDLRPWMPPDPQSLQRDEERMLERVNGVLLALGAPQLERIAQLTAGDAQTLFTLRELDPYAAYRNQAEYLGPLQGPAGAPPQWPAGKGKRIFFYARRFSALPAMLQILRDSGQSVLVHVGNLTPDERARYSHASLRFADTLLDMDTVAAECDVAVLTSGHGTTAALLLAGKPMLLLPQFLEMQLIANAVRALGAGLAAPHMEPAAMHQKLDRLLQDPVFTRKAEEFRSRYHDSLSADGARRRFVNVIERLASGS